MIQVVTGLKHIVRLDLGVPSREAIVVCIEEELVAGIAKASMSVQGQRPKSFEGPRVEASRSERKRRRGR